MSAEALATVISSAVLLSAFFACSAWMIRHRDAQFEKLGAQFDKLGDRLTGFETNIRTDLGDRLTGLETRLGDRLTGFETGLGDRLTGVERELVEIRISLARIEGPLRHPSPLADE